MLELEAGRRPAGWPLVGLQFALAGERGKAYFRLELYIPSFQGCCTPPPTLTLILTLTLAPSLFKKDIRNTPAISEP